MLHSVANPQLIFVSIFTYLITEEGDGLNEWKNFKNELMNRLGYDEASSSSSNSSRSSSSKTDRWVHFQQNAGLRLSVHTWIIQAQFINSIL